MKNKFIYITLTLFVIAFMYKPIKTEGATYYGWGINSVGQKMYFYDASGIPSYIRFRVYNWGMDAERPISFYQVNEIGSTTPIPNTQSTGYLSVVTLINGNGVSIIGSSDNFYSSYDDYIDSITPKWWEKMWNDFRNYWNDPALGNWVQNLINHIFGDDNEGTIADNVNFSAPTIAPTPTPIPYSTVVIPKTDIVTGDTVYETNYYYVNPSGTPIITNSPPTNSPSSGGGGGGSTEYVPIGGDPFSIPAVSWLTSATIGDSNYDGIDSINEGMGSIDSIGSEYTDGMNAVQESTGTLPTSWLLLIGIAAAIPLLAGIVSRFLGG